MIGNQPNYFGAIYCRAAFSLLYLIFACLSFAGALEAQTSLTPQRQPMGPVSQTKTDSYQSIGEIDRARKRASEQLATLRQRGQSISSLHNGMRGIEESNVYSKPAWIAEHGLILQAAKSWLSIFPRETSDKSKISDLVQLATSLRTKQAAKLQTQLQGQQGQAAVVSNIFFANFSPLVGDMDRNLTNQLMSSGVFFSGWGASVISTISVIGDDELSKRANIILKEAQTRFGKLANDVCHEFGMAASSVEQWAPSQNAVASEIEMDEIRRISGVAGECVAYAGRRLQAIDEYASAHREMTQSLATLLVAAAEKNEVSVKDVISQMESLDQAEARSAEVWRKPSIVDDGAQKVIMIALGAWLLILSIVVLAILYLGHKIGRDLAVGPNGFNYAMFLEMISVFILTATILILGLASRLDSQAVAALIGGISGYVLGRINAATRSSPPSS